MLPMDLLAAPALAAIISALVSSSAGAAGKDAWESLKGLVRRVFAKDDAASSAVEGTPDQRSAEVLSRELAARAEEDQDFAAALRTWAEGALPLVADSQDVSNVIGGNAQIRGNVVQARDIGGSVTFGDTSSSA
jgi:hypothetical protein